MERQQGELFPIERAVLDVPDTLAIQPVYDMSEYCFKLKAIWADGANETLCIVAASEVAE